MAVSNNRTAASFCSKLATAYSFSFTSTVFPICADLVCASTPTFFDQLAHVRRMDPRVCPCRPSAESIRSLRQDQHRRFSQRGSHPDACLARCQTCDQLLSAIKGFKHGEQIRRLEHLLFPRRPALAWSEQNRCRIPIDNAARHSQFEYGTQPEPKVIDQAPATSFRGLIQKRLQRFICDVAQHPISESADEMEANLRNLRIRRGILPLPTLKDRNIDVFNELFKSSRPDFSVLGSGIDRFQNVLQHQLRRMACDLRAETELFCSVTSFLSTTERANNFFHSVYGSSSYPVGIAFDAKCFLSCVYGDHS